MVLPVALALVLSFLSPFLNAWIQDVNWSPQAKNLLAIATSAIVAIIYLLFTGGIGDWTQIATVIPQVYILQQAIYQFFLKNIATKFEALTSKNSVVVTPSATAGSVDVTTDATIKATGDNVTVPAPVEVTTTTTKTDEPFIPAPEVKG